MGESVSKPLRCGVAGLLIGVVFAGLAWAGGPTGSVSGQVTDADSGQVLAGVTVKAIQDGAVAARATTDASGNYVLKKLAPGTYDLEGSKETYGTTTVTGITVSKGETATVPLGLSPDIQALGQISGTVQIRIGEAKLVPLEDALVEARHGGAVEGAATTDDSGAYVIPGLPAASYDVSISRAGCLPITVKDQVVVADSTTSVDVTLASDLDPPTPPSGLVVMPDTNSVRLTWNASQDNVAVYRYCILREDRGDICLGHTTGLSYTHSGLLPGTDYCYSVEASDGRNHSGPNETVCVTTKPASSPMAPVFRYEAILETSGAWTDLANATDGVDGTTASVASKRASLTWRGWNAEGHPMPSEVVKVELGVPHAAIGGDGNDGVQLQPVFGSTTGSASATFPSDASITTSWYDVTADSRGPGVGRWTSGELATLSAKVLTAASGKVTPSRWSVDDALLRVSYVDTASPTAPWDLRVSDVAPTWVLLEWNPSSDDVGVCGYAVYDASDDTLLQTVESPYWSSLIGGFEPFTAYSYYVRAYDWAGNLSLPSNTLNGRTQPLDDLPPSAPANFRVPQGPRETSLYLEWDASVDDYGVAGYHVYLDGVRVGDTPNPAYTASGLEPNTEYKFSAEAYDLVGNLSPRSADYVVSTIPVDTERPSPPPGVQANRTIFPDCLRVDWLPATDNVWVYYYRIYVDGEWLKDKWNTPSELVCEVPAGACRKFQVSAVDWKGLESEPSEAAIGCTASEPPTIQIVSPLADQTVVGPFVSVMGTVNGGARSVYVNGLPARVSNGSFVCDQVPIAEGETTITAVAYSVDRVAASAEVTVVGVADSAAVTLTASPAGGSAPLTVLFSAQVAGTMDVTSCEWDLDGDGTFEAASPAPCFQTSTYAEGVHPVRVRVTDPSGVSYIAVRTVQATAEPVILAPILVDSVRGIAVDRSGNLYAAQGNLGSVSVFSPEGLLLRTIGTPGQIGSAEDVAVDAGGNVLVVDAASQCVRRFPADGAVAGEYGGGILTAPRAIAVDDSGTIYVSDEAAGRIRKFDEAGQLLASFGEPGEPWSGLLSPRGLVLGKGGALYVADSGYQRVVRLATNGDYLGAFDGSGSGVLTDVAWDAVNETLLVAEAGTERVILADGEGVLKGTVQLSNAGVSSADAVASGTDDLRMLLYVADSNAGKVARLEIPYTSPLSVWDALQARLAARDMEGALVYIAERSRDKYRELFQVLYERLPAVAAGMGAPVLKSRSADAAKYAITKQETQDGQPVSTEYPVYFERDENGVWKVASF